MLLLYKTKKQYFIQISGEKILFPSCTEVTVHRIYENAIGRPVKKKVLTTSNGNRYIVWDGDGIALNSFLSFSLDKFLTFFPCDNSTFFNNILVYSTLIKYSKNIGIITQASPYFAAMPVLTKEEFDVNNPKDMLYDLSTKNYNIDAWQEKISITPSNQKHWVHFSDITFTLDEFISALKSGTIRIVDKKAFLEKYNEEKNQFEQLPKRKQKKSKEEFDKTHSIMI